MTGQKKKKRLPIPAAALTVLLLAVLLSAVFLSGCASSKYQAIEIEGDRDGGCFPGGEGKRRRGAGCGIRDGGRRGSQSRRAGLRGCRSAGTAGSGPERGNLASQAPQEAFVNAGSGLASASGNVRERGSCRAASRSAGGRRDVFSTAISWPSTPGTRRRRTRRKSPSALLRKP